MTVDNLLLKLKDFDKNLIVCISKNPWNAYTISNVSRRPDNNTIIFVFIFLPPKKKFLFYK